MTKKLKNQQASAVAKNKYRFSNISVQKAIRLGLNPKNKKVRNFCHFLAEVLVLKNTNIFLCYQSAQQSTIKTIYNNLCLQKKMRFRNFLTFYRKILRTENCLKAYSIGFKTGHGLITRQGDNFLIRVRNISI